MRKSPRVHSGYRYLEHKMQVAFFQTVAYLGMPHHRTIFAVPNAARRSAQQGKRLKDEGMKAGIPDVICPFPRSGFASLMIEFKCKGNSPSPAQQEMIAALIKAGNAVCVARSAADAYSLLSKYEAGQLTQEDLYKKFKRTLKA